MFIGHLYLSFGLDRKCIEVWSRARCSQFLVYLSVCYGCGLRLCFQVNVTKRSYMRSDLVAGKEESLNVPRLEADRQVQTD